jgi:hypothetical protein
MSTKTTTSHATYIEFTKPFSYSCHGDVRFISVGVRLKIQNRDLCNEGYCIGNGIDQIVPWDYFKLVGVTTERTVTETITEH